MSTRADILRSARELFMEKGYNGVSMRDIAERAGIRVGNLTYYFPRKELLVEALFEARESRIMTPESLDEPEDLLAYLRHLLSVQRTTSFYFDSYIQLSQTSERLRQFQCGRMERLRGLFLASLRAMAERGVIAPEGRPGDMERRVEMLLTVVMLRLPGEERRCSPPEADEAVLDRVLTLIGLDADISAEKHEKSGDA